MQFSINDFFSKCDQIRRKVRIWSHLLKKFLLENFTFCAVNIALPSSMYDKDKGKSHIILRRKAVIFCLIVKPVFGNIIITAKLILQQNFTLWGLTSTNCSLGSKATIKLLLKRCRHSRPAVFCKKGVLRNFSKFTGKDLCQSIFVNKVGGLTPATLIKKRLWYRCFSVNFEKFLTVPFLTKHFRWLLLKMIIIAGFFVKLGVRRLRTSSVMWNCILTACAILVYRMAIRPKLNAHKSS